MSDGAIPARLPENESQRLAELYSYGILDTLPEQAYDDATFLAAQICDTPIALITLLDRDRQWFKSRVGLDVSQTPRTMAFCGYAILDPAHPTIVPDAADDERFRNNPLVTGDPMIRFYAGAPLPLAARSLASWVNELPDLAPSPGMAEAISFLRSPPLPRPVKFVYRILFEAAVTTLPPRVRSILGLRSWPGAHLVGLASIRILRRTLGRSPSWLLALRRVEVPLSE